MKLQNGHELCFGIAYWKRRWVGVPFFHLPEGAISADGKAILAKIGGDSVASAAKTASDYLTFKSLIAKIFDPELLKNSQFGIPFRAGMTAATLAAEALICK